MQELPPYARLWRLRSQDVQTAARGGDGDSGYYEPDTPNPDVPVNPDNPGSPAEPDNPGVPDSPNPDQPDVPVNPPAAKSVVEILKEIMGEETYEKELAKLKSDESIEMNEIKIKAIGDIFPLLEQMAAGEGESISNSNKQEIRDCCTAFVAQAEKMIYIRKKKASDVENYDFVPPDTIVYVFSTEINVTGNILCDEINLALR